MTATGQRSIVALGLACGLVLVPTGLAAQSQPVPLTPASGQDYESATQDPGFHTKPPHQGTRRIIDQSYDGVDFLGSNCGCLPPDTNAAVGNGYIVETVNVQIRIFDKATGSILLDEPLETFFGSHSDGDVYVVYDDTADRWYVSAFDSTEEGLFLAVSKDGNPLHGFLPTYHLTDVGGFPDYQKPGFNEDAIFISYNDFGSGGAAATIVSIDKVAALSGTLRHFVSHPEFQFRAMPPAQMHSSKDRDWERLHPQEKGGVEWFVSTDGTDAGGISIRVTKMTDYLSVTPSFTYTSLPVSEYRYATKADQPGGSITTSPNTTTTQVQYHKGHLVTAMASSTAQDGFVYPKGQVYQIDVSNGWPTLLKQDVIDPGDGVAVQIPSVDEDENGNLGLAWMESSNTEYLSMWVGILGHITGGLVTSVAAPGGGFFLFNSRIGDYSTTVLDPADSGTFWSANEYIGDGGSSNIWRTHIASFRFPEEKLLSLDAGP